MMCEEALEFALRERDAARAERDALREALRIIRNDAGVLPVSEETLSRIYQIARAALARKGE